MTALDSQSLVIPSLLAWLRPPPLTARLSCSSAARARRHHSVIEALGAHGKVSSVQLMIRLAKFGPREGDKCEAATEGAHER
jgi:hypothetical protein